MNVKQAQTVVNTLNELKAANKAAKKKLLVDAITDETFLKVLTLTLDSRLSFKVSRVKETESIEGNVFDFLEELSKKPAANARDKTFLAGLASQSPYHLDIVNRILRGRLDAGFDIKTILEIDDTLIFHSPYCRCSGYEEIDNIDFSKGAYSQLKADGMFLNIHLDSWAVRYTTRNGNDLRIPGVETRFAVFPNDHVLMGEALVMNEGRTGFLPRAKGNAIINKGQDGTISQEEASRIRFFLWDMIPAADFKQRRSLIPYSERFTKAQEYCGISSVEMIETRIVWSLGEAKAHYKEIRNRPMPEGTKPLEGTILKDAGALWEDGTSKYQVKGKALKSCEVLVTGWNPGKIGGKNENRIGSLVVQSGCGKLVGSVSGLTDEQRNRDPESWVGQIITVEFNDVSESKATDIRSFDHARIDGDVRTDKKVADDLEYILAVKEVDK